MGGKQAKSTSVSYSGSSNPAFSPYAIQGVSDVNAVYNANKGGLQDLTNNLTGTIIPGLQSQYGTAAGVANQGLQYNSDVLSGKYLNGNPFLQGIINQTNEDIGNSVGGHFSTSGRYGSGANQAVMEKQMANADNALRYQNYNDQMNRMDQAAQQGQTASTADLATLLQAIGQGAALPYTGSESLANSLGALFSGGSDTSKSTGGKPSLLGSILGAGASLGSAAILKSDRRLKSNIVKVGELEDGLGIYDYDIDGQRQRGVMAGEVKQLRPWAYVPGYFNGFDGVNYAALSVA